MLAWALSEVQVKPLRSRALQMEDLISPILAQARPGDHQAADQRQAQVTMPSYQSPVVEPVIIETRAPLRQCGYDSRICLSSVVASFFPCGVSGFSSVCAYWKHLKPARA